MRASNAAAEGVSTARTAPTDWRRAPCWLACRLAPPRRPRLWRFVRCELLEDAGHGSLDELLGRRPAPVRRPCRR
eukprot:7514377-Lingulodinium_polyedra.AAC.1